MLRLSEKRRINREREMEKQDWMLINYKLMQLKYITTKKWKRKRERELETAEREEVNEVRNRKA